ncbi:hypothetical protein E3O42_04750 [Cryobacterium adonitolivorans]|uniref:Uncharacterized protein n=1 Tax=Cryobacterium adonitolivorans TaxID=1259189 RepID=A0A4R8W8K9_9MICO|nr:hypothetical protein [Cryobacterium adonitolivorans]TFC04808.1 hypothetical protein E3O42_04750 [Cryobacterium adonitolivorans]
MIWLVAVVCAVLTGVLVAPAGRLVWISLALAGCTILTLAAQLSTGQKEGYVHRVTLSLVGAVLVLGAATGIFALVGLV